MDFAEPLRLVWLVGVAALAGVHAWQARRAAARLARLGDLNLIRALVDPAAAARGRWRAACLYAGLVLLVLAAARPRFGIHLTEVRRRGNDVLLAVDVSRSMLAEDVAPSRLVAARRALTLLVRALHGDRVGVLAFAGEAFVQCPLTFDADAAVLYLDALDPAAAPAPGTALGTAIRKAVARFPKASGARKLVVLLTDGEETRDSDPLGAARDAAAAGVVVDTVGLGSPDRGEVIRQRDAAGAVTGYVKDEKGETVMSKMDEPTLRQIATITGGRYVRAGGDDGDLLALADTLSGAGGPVSSTQMSRVREERYQWFLLLALVCLIAERLIPRTTGHWRRVRADLRAESFRLAWRRPGLLPLLLAAALAAGATPARADFKGAIRHGNRLARDGRLEEARQAYYGAQSERPEAAEPAYNTGNTWLAEGKFDDALKAYDQAAGLTRHPGLLDAIHYNRGVTLYYAGREAEAREAFKEALRWNPKDEDARYNLEWLASPKRPRQQKPGSGQPQAGKPGKTGDQMKKEDAERLLEMARDGERRARQQARPKAKPGDAKGGGKDW